MQSYQKEFENATFSAEVSSSTSAAEESEVNNLDPENNPKLCKRAHLCKRKRLEWEIQQSEREMQEDLAKMGYDPDVNVMEWEKYQEDEEIMSWSQEDFQQLVQRIENVLPENDTLAFSTRVEKINWDEVAFDSYSAEQCKRSWFLVQKKIRRFRLMVELLQDARKLLNSSWPYFLKNHDRHPDMPQQPLTEYSIFYLKKKDKIILKHPGIELSELSNKIGIMFQNLSGSKMEKLNKMAAEARTQYEIKLEEFYQSHPEVTRTASTLPKAFDTPPKKPLTPFVMFYEHKLKTLKIEGDRAFKEQCKIQWKGLSDKKKLFWIDWAVSIELKYQEDLKNYTLQNPSFAPVAIKSILNKQERLLKDKFRGKPKRPPQSAYSLFARVAMRSDDIKKMGIKYRLKSIMAQWKHCSTEERIRFKDYSDYLLTKYEMDYVNYLNSLAEKKKQGMENNAGKRKKKSNEAIDNTVVFPLKKPKMETITSAPENDLPQENQNQETAQMIFVPKENKNQETVQMTFVPKENENQEAAQSIIVPKENENQEIVLLKKNDNQETAPKIDEEPKPSTSKMDQDEPVSEQEREAIRIQWESDFLKAIQVEPEAPPRDAFELFCTLYRGKGSRKVAFGKLSNGEKEKYSTELQTIKAAHIEAYACFLKGLSREHLNAYSVLRKRLLERKAAKK